MDEVGRGDGREWVAGFRGRLAELSAAAARARGALDAVEGTASSADGAVMAVVDAAGGLQRLVLGERCEAMTRTQLAAAVVATARAAQDDAARRAADAVRPLLGDGAARLLHAREQR